MERSLITLMVLVSYEAVKLTLFVIQINLSQVYLQLLITSQVALNAKTKFRFLTLESN